jgi:exodeoxyribonuclease-3
MTIASWNVNGIRAVAKKGFEEILSAANFDILCLQETKAQNEQVDEALKNLDNYHIISNSAERKGYSGVSILSKEKPLRHICGIGIPEHDDEGRVLTAEFPDYYVVSVYVPNSGNGLRRLDYRRQWDIDFLAFLQKLEKDKPVVVGGDFNVAHQEIDIARPKANYNKTPGYTQDEIDGFQQFIASGFVDSFRYLHPDTVKYSWWSYRAGAREKNIGWRLDYLLLSPELLPQLQSAEIHNHIHGSDHCPVEVVLSDEL